MPTKPCPTYQLITDDESLSRAFTRFGYEIKFSDDGDGPLWILRNSMGIQGIVRARTWEDAWAICEDDIFPSPDADAMGSWEEEYGPDFPTNPLWCEAYGYRNNATDDGCCYYEKDIHGEHLDRLGSELLNELDITLVLVLEQTPEGLAPATPFNVRIVSGNKYLPEVVRVLEAYTKSLVDSTKAPATLPVSGS